MPHIVVTRRVHDDAIARLHSLGTVRIWEGSSPIPAPRLTEWLADAHACLTMLTDRIDDDVLAGAPHLRIVSNMAVGYDNFDVASATQRGVLLTNTPDVLTEATADLTWALILAMMRNIVPSRNAILAGQWTSWSPTGFLGSDLGGKTLGIVGWGRIGQAVARRAGAFGMSVITLTHRDRTLPEALPQAEFLARADVISLHVPLTDATRHLINRHWLSQVKPSSYLINTARGDLVEEDALLWALDTGRLKGAAVDVFSQEPAHPDHPLVLHPRVLATPHIGSATAETRRAMALRATENIASALSGRRPQDLLNPGAQNRSH